MVEKRKKKTDKRKHKEDKAGGNIRKERGRIKKRGRIKENDHLRKDLKLSKLGLGTLKFYMLPEKY